jgi:hypothetical protein
MLFPPVSLCSVHLFARVGKQRHNTRALDGSGQLTLMTGTGSGYATGQYLRPIGNEPVESGKVFVINGFNFIHAEGTNFSATFAVVRSSVVSVVSVASIVSHGISSFSVIQDEPALKR